MSTVALTIDYSNGAHKHFSNIPWKEGLTILGAVEASEGIPPGASIRFGSDRSGHALGLVIDEMPPGIHGHPNGLSGSTPNRFKGVSARRQASGFTLLNASSIFSNRVITS